MGFGVVRPEGQRLLVIVPPPRRACPGASGHCRGCCGLGIVRVDGQRPSVAGRWPRRICPALAGRSPGCCRREEVGLEGDRACRRPCRPRRCFPGLSQHFAQVVMPFGEMRPESDRSLKACRGLVELAAALEDAAEVDVCLKEVGLESHGALELARQLRRACPASPARRPGCCMPRQNSAAERSLAETVPRPDRVCPACGRCCPDCCAPGRGRA